MKHDESAIPGFPYLELVHELPDIMYKIDPEGRFTFLSNSISRWGHDPCALLGRHFSEVIHPEDVPRVTRESVLATMREEGACTDEPPRIMDERRTGARITKHLKVRLKPGPGPRSVHREPHYEVFATGTYAGGNGSGRVLSGTFGIMRDVSEVESGERALVRTEHYYRRLTEDSTDIVSVLAHDGTILFKSESARRILGRDPVEMIGSHETEFVHWDDAAAFSAVLEMEWVHPIVHSVAYRFLHGGGEWRVLEATIKRVSDANDATACFVLNSRDITEMERARGQIRESAKKFKTIVGHLSEVIVIVDAAGDIEYVSEIIEPMLGYTPIQIAGTSILDLFHPRDRSVIMERLNMWVSSCRDGVIPNIRVCTRGGVQKTVEIAVCDLRNDPCIGGILLNMRDTTDKTENERARRRSENKFRTLYENALVGMMTIDLSKRTIIAANDMGYSLFGHASKDEFIGLPIQEKIADGQRWQEIRSALREHGEVRNAEVLFRRTDGSTFWGGITAKVFAGEGIIEAIVIDITKSKENEENVFRLRHYDPLTELPNKQMLALLLQREILHNNKFLLMCIGVDRFKNINEMFGIGAGDELLKAIADKLRLTYFKKDVVSHFEGDKFVVLLLGIGTFDRETDLDRIAKIAKKAQDIFADTFSIGDAQIAVTTSIGLVVYPDDGTTPESLLKNCESAMYIAKGRGGKAFHYYDGALNEKMMSRLVLERQISRAIQENEFVLHYQPKVDAMGRIAGLEALIRWRAPSGAFVSPAEFIPLAEKNGMIIDIGRIALETACAQGKRWQEAGIAPVRIAVNLSPYQFSHEDLLRDIAGALAKTGLDPQWLELEITESGIMNDEEDGVRKLGEIHRMGIALSIDDFGTGYSSLSKLRLYPLDALKIDKSFVDYLPGDRMSETIAAAIVTLGHNLGFKLVAEGVETREQLDFLVKTGCDLFQGYLYYKPLAPEDVERFLERA